MNQSASNNHPIPVSPPTTQLRNEAHAHHLPQTSAHKSPSSPRSVSFHFLPFPYSLESSSYHRRQLSSPAEICEDTEPHPSDDSTTIEQPTIEETPHRKRRSTTSRLDSTASTMGHSLESSRPIMAGSVTSKRESTRFSTYSQAPSFTPTAHTSLTSDSAQAEIANIEEGLEKLENKKLTTQRYVLNQEKAEDMSKLALGAKLERALGRRMGGQDAEFRVRKKVVVDNEKVSEKQIVA